MTLPKDPRYLITVWRSLAAAERESVVLLSGDETESSDPTPCTPPQEW